MQPKNGAKCCKNTAVISRRVRLELTTFDFNGLEYCFILNRSLPILFQQFIAWVNSFGNKMKVISPKKVVDKINSALQSALEQYE